MFGILRALSVVQKISVVGGAGVLAGLSVLCLGCEAEQELPLCENNKDSKKTYTFLSQPTSRDKYVRVKQEDVIIDRLKITPWVPTFWNIQKDLCPLAEPKSLTSPTHEDLALYRPTFQYIRNTWFQNSQTFPSREGMGLEEISLECSALSEQSLPPSYTFNYKTSSFVRLDKFVDYPNIADFVSDQIKPLRLYDLSLSVQTGEDKLNSSFLISDGNNYSVGLVQSNLSDSKNRYQIIWKQQLDLGIRKPDFLKFLTDEVFPLDSQMALPIAVGRKLPNSMSTFFYSHLLFFKNSGGEIKNPSIFLKIPAEPSCYSDKVINRDPQNPEVSFSSIKDDLKLTTFVTNASLQDQGELSLLWVVQEPQIDADLLDKAQSKIYIPQAGPSTLFLYEWKKNGSDAGKPIPMDPTYQMKLPTRYTIYQSLIQGTSLLAVVGVNDFQVKVEDDRARIDGIPFLTLIDTETKTILKTQALSKSRIPIQDSQSWFFKDHPKNAFDRQFGFSPASGFIPGGKEFFLNDQRFEYNSNSTSYEISAKNKIVTLEVEDFEYEFLECRSPDHESFSASPMLEKSLRSALDEPLLVTRLKFMDGIWLYLLPNRDAVVVEYNERNKRAFSFRLPDEAAELKNSRSYPCYEFYNFWDQQLPLLSDRRISSCMWQYGSYASPAVILKGGHLFFGYGKETLHTDYWSEK